MKQFEKEKEKLIAALNQLAELLPEHQWIDLLQQDITQITHPKELKGDFKKVLATIKQVAKFEKYFMKEINLIQSKELRKLAKHLRKEKCEITFFGKAWSKQAADWIYFDTVLAVEQIKETFNFGNHIQIHKNTDPRSGKELGFIDTKTGEGLMGRLG